MRTNSPLPRRSLLALVFVPGVLVTGVLVGTGTVPAYVVVPVAGIVGFSAIQVRRGIAGAAEATEVLEQLLTGWLGEAPEAWVLAFPRGSIRAEWQEELNRFLQRRNAIFLSRPPSSTPGAAGSSTPGAGAIDPGAPAALTAGVVVAVCGGRLHLVPIRFERTWQVRAPITTLLLEHTRIEQDSTSVCTTLSIASGATVAELEVWPDIAGIGAAALESVIEACGPQLAGTDPVRSEDVAALTSTFVAQGRKPPSPEQLLDLARVHIRFDILETGRPPIFEQLRAITPIDRPGLLVRTRDQTLVAAVPPSDDLPRGELWWLGGGPASTTTIEPGVLRFDTTEPEPVSVQLGMGPGGHVLRADPPTRLEIVGDPADLQRLVPGPADG